MSIERELYEEFLAKCISENSEAKILGELVDDLASDSRIAAISQKHSLKITPKRNLMLNDIRDLEVTIDDKIRLSGLKNVRKTLQDPGPYESAEIPNSSRGFNSGT